LESNPPENIEPLPQPPTAIQVESAELEPTVTDITTQAETEDLFLRKKLPVIIPKKGPKKFGTLPVPQNADELINPLNETPEGTLPFHRYDQPKKDSQMRMTKADYKALIGTGPLYKNLPPFNLKDMFKDPLWHPGQVTNTAHFCFMHGANLYAGGQVYDWAEKFSKLYVRRTRTAQNYALTDMAINGVSFMNLQWILYDKNTDLWYSPRLKRQIERIVLDDVAEGEYSLGSLFDEFGGTRFLVQVVDLAESMD
jgi:hypothetical protein